MISLFMNTLLKKIALTESQKNKKKQKTKFGKCKIQGKIIFFEIHISDTQWKNFFFEWHIKNHPETKIKVPIF